MIDGLRVLAIVPARGGSKGVPRKNVRPVGGKPLIHWTLEAARDSAFVDCTAVSSDDDEILTVARELGCSLELHRPAELANDHATSADVVLHTLDALPGYDVAILLQPTSPFRTPADIDGCLKLLQTKKADSCVSICEAGESPYWMYRLGTDERLAPLLNDSGRYTRRQDLPRVFLPNGALYAFRIEWMRFSRSFIDSNTIGFIMPPERSLDIDTELDMINAEHLFSVQKS